MALYARIFFFVFASFFLIVGAAALFRPEQIASQLGVEILNAEGMGAVRSIIGGHYLAMSLVCMFAAVRNISSLLFPIGAIAAAMVIARLVSFANGEFTQPAMVQTIIELIGAVTLTGASWKSALNSGDKARS